MNSKGSLYSSTLDLYLNCEVEDGAAIRLFVSREPTFTETKEEILLMAEEYLSGKDVDLLSIPVRMKGTEFQKKVWEALRRIPKGQVMSYSEIAERIGKPNAARAVGNAVGSNHLLLLVPCHRVVSRNGIGGFSAEGGIETKRKILRAEQ